MRYRNSRPLLRLVFAQAATTALVPALMLTGGTARAAGPSAHRPAGAPQVISAGLTSVSCKGDSFCMAAGTYRTQRLKGLKLIEAWNGKGWHDVPDPLSGHLSAISCGSPTFCFAARGGISRLTSLGAVWNGRTWKAFKDGFDAVGATCGSPKLCLNTDKGGTELDVWNGKRWRTDPTTDACTGEVGGPCGYNDLSCGSASSCMAMTAGCETADCDYPPFEFAAVWNGNRWISADYPPASGNLSCSRGLFCMLISSNAQDNTIAASIWGPAGWQDVTPDLSALCASAQKCGLPLNGGLSCGAPQDCVVISPGSPVSLIWSNFAWTAVPLATAGGTVPNLRDLSCGSSTNCMAVGSYGKPAKPVAEHWNGTSWQLTKPVNH